MTCLPILFVRQIVDLTLFFSAASFYPGRDGRDDEETIEYPPDSFHLSDSNDGDTDVESEQDWFEDPQPAMINSSKVSEATAIEVSIPFLIS